MHINKITKLNLHDLLPLTCTRIGTCCHGNQVLLNPWELFIISKEKQITAREFRDLYCDLGGIRLKFDGDSDAREKKACSQYVDNFGCSVHLGRPLACRLFPIGRQIQNNEVHYIHQGDTFPCLNGCTEVVNLPKLTVQDYLKDQSTNQHEKAQDVYLELMQNLADIAFELLLNSGLSESGDKSTLPAWRKMSFDSPEALAKKIGNDWMDALLIPEVVCDTDDPNDFAIKHYELLQLKAHAEFEGYETVQQFYEASVLIMGLAIHLARAMGTNPETLTEHWIETAKSFGAQE